MIHHLIADVGWPFLVLAALLFVCALPSLISWVRFEIQLSRRVRAYEQRMEAARVARVRW